MSYFPLPKIIMRPLDEYNQRLIANLHPSNWVNPQPAKIYDLIIIGGGSAGLAIARQITGLNIGLKVALIEKYLIGGDYLNHGCIPTRSLMRTARVVGELQQAQELGVIVPAHIPIDFPSVMTRMRRLREQMSSHYNVEGLQKSGIDVFLGEGRFLDQDYIAVGDIKLRYQKAAIATGAKSYHPPIPGLETCKYITKETVFSLTQLPHRLAVIGGGKYGCEIAQIFQRLGSQVTLFHRSHLLHREDGDVGKIISETFKREGIKLFRNSQVLRVEQQTHGKTIYHNLHGQEEVCMVDEIFVATGQIANVENLNLTAVGVEFSPRYGVKVNDYLQTTNSRIFAAGDVCLDWKFSHAAEAAARIVVKNALFSPLKITRQKFSRLVIPRVTHTQPEVAHVGLYEQDAVSQEIDVSAIQISMANLDSAIADGESEGFIRILHRRGSDEIIGATIVADRAGEMISSIATAMTHQIGLKKLGFVIHPYPTQTAAIKKVAEAYRRTLLTPRMQILWRWLAKFS